MWDFQQFGVGQQQPQQLAQQGFPGGLVGRGTGGLFGNSQLSGQFGQYVGGIGGIPPFPADLSQAYAQALQQQDQLSPQGWLGGAISGPLGNSGMGGTIGGAAGNLGALLPFAAGPQPPQQMQQVLQLFQQQIQEQIQQLQQLQQFLQLLQLQQLQQLQQSQQVTQQQMLQQPAALQALQGQQDQLAPQDWFGSAAGLPGRPLGGLIGGMASNQPGGMLPFPANPYQMQQVQQQLAAQQGQPASPGWLGNPISQFGQSLGGLIGGMAGNQQQGRSIGSIAGHLGRMLPFSVDPYQLQQIQQQQQLVAQQGQLAPAGWFGQPLGGLIGSLSGNQQFGSIASQIGRNQGGPTLQGYSPAQGGRPQGAGNGFTVH
jgi:hypothetical protein